MQANGLKTATRLAALVAVVGMALFTSGCVDRLSVSAAAEPSLIVMGEGAVSLVGEVTSRAEFAELEWRLARRPEGSSLSFPQVFESEASFVPDVPGEYEFQFIATGGGTRTGGGLASGVGGRTVASTHVKVSVLRRPVGVLGFVTQPTEVGAGNPFDPSVSVELRNDEGEIVAEPIAVTLTLRGGAQGARLLGAESVTTVEGVATFTDLSVDLVGKSYTLEAKADGMTSAESDPFDVVAGSADESKSTLVIAPEILKADGKAQAVVSLTLKDAYDNLVANESVSLEATGTGHEFADEEGKTDAQGRYSTTLTSTTAENKTVTATFGTPPRTLSATVSFLKEIPSAGYSEFLVPEEMVADGEQEAELMVVLRGENGDPAPGVLVTFSSPEPADVFSDKTVETNEEGVAVVVLTTTKSGRRRLKASFVNESISESMSFRAGLPSRDTSTFTAEPHSIPADGESKSLLTAVLRDKFENPVADAPIWFSADQELPALLYVDSDFTDENGVGTARITSAQGVGSRTLTVYSSGPNDEDFEMSLEIVFTPAPPVIYEIGTYRGELVTGVCMGIWVEVGQSQDLPVTLRFEYRDENGRLHDATNLDGDGNETTDSYFDWNANADVRGWEADSVTLVVTPFIEVDGELIEGEAAELEFRIGRPFEGSETLELKNVGLVATWKSYDPTALVCSATSPPSLSMYEWDWEAEALFGGTFRDVEEAPTGIRLADFNRDGLVDEVLWFAGTDTRPGWLELRLSDVVEEQRATDGRAWFRPERNFETIVLSEISPTDVFVWDEEGKQPAIIVVGTETEAETKNNVVALLNFESEILLSRSEGPSAGYFYLSREMRHPLTGVTAGRLDWEAGTESIVVTDAAGGVHVFSPDDTGGVAMASHENGMSDAAMPLIVRPPEGPFEIFTASRADRSVSVMRRDESGVVYLDGVIVASGLESSPVGFETGYFNGSNGPDEVLLVLESGDVHLFEYEYDYRSESQSLNFLSNVSKVASGVSSVAVGHFNDDSVLDFATAHPAADVVTVVYGSYSYLECSGAARP